jgi:predicted secreted hydrolase
MGNAKFFRGASGPAIFIGERAGGCFLGGVRWVFPVLVLWFLAIAEAAAGGWRLALPGWEYEFPRDHGSHPDFRTEWWYFTGNLESETGSEFGYQLTFFRQGVVEPGVAVPEGSRFVQRDVKFAHFAVSDIAAQKFHHFQKLARGAFGEAGFDGKERLAWIDGWECRRTGMHDFRLRAEEGDVAVDLQLVAERGPVFHGSDGVSQKAQGEGRASHYYSLTRLRTEGTVRLGEQTHAVRGWTWFDHEWATNQLAAHQSGWDWFSLQFDDGSDLMLFQIRTKDGGRDEYSSGTLVDESGEILAIPCEEFSLEPVRWWKSEKSGGHYPVEWKVRIPKLKMEFTVRARFDAQELVAEPFSYWEGAVAAEGVRDGAPVQAKGYLEMTGYAGRIVGMQAE